MFIGLIANPHRPHATIARQRRHDPLMEDRFAAKAIDRLKVILRRGGHDVHQPGEIVLHLAHRRETIERPHDEIGVSHPAVSIIPVALRVGSLGNACRQGGDDRSRGFISAELERYRGANNGVLPLERYGQSMRPR